MTSNKANRVIQLKCSCNNYPWGKIGPDSTAARYCQSTPGNDFKINDGEVYSEMWMGTYPSLPSYSLDTGELLQDVLDRHKEALIGKPVIEKLGSDLPFLPKVLSISKSLPLQIHPDKELATRLHQLDPDKFSDSNHKPEIAVVLSDKFEAFVGFKPLNDIQSLFSLAPFQNLLPIPGNHSNFNNETLRTICHKLLTLPDEAVAQTLKSLSDLPSSAFGSQAYISSLLPRLIEQHSLYDSGALVALLCMNYVVLRTGEALYIPADGIHAYLAGDIFECMARSNNMLATGLCPQAERDSAELFTQALTFEPHSSAEALLVATPSKKSCNDKTLVYAPPLSEFQVLVTDLKDGESELIKALAGPSILFVAEGKGNMTVAKENYQLSSGFVFFVGQGSEIRYEATETFKVYVVYAE